MHLANPPTLPASPTCNRPMEARLSLARSLGTQRQCGALPVVITKLGSTFSGLVIVRHPVHCMQIGIKRSEHTSSSPSHATYHVRSEAREQPLQRPSELECSKEIASTIFRVQSGQLKRDSAHLAAQRKAKSMTERKRMKEEEERRSSACNKERARRGSRGGTTHRTCGSQKTIKLKK